jgi:hypothetical protein
VLQLLVHIVRRTDQLHILPELITQLANSPMA